MSIKITLPIKATINKLITLKAAKMMKVDFEALNQGFSGPNTAQFMIFDDKGSLISSNQWKLGTGFKATIIIVKE